MLSTSRSRLETVVSLDTSSGNDHDGVKYELIHGVEDIVRSLEVILYRCSVIMKRNLEDAAHDVLAHLLCREPSQAGFRRLLRLFLVGGEDVHLHAWIKFPDFGSSCFGALDDVLLATESSSSSSLESLHIADVEVGVRRTQLGNQLRLRHVLTFAARQLNSESRGLASRRVLWKQHGLLN